MFTVNPSKKIPAEYQSQWWENIHKSFKNRLYVMASATIVGFLVVDFLTLILDPKSFVLLREFFLFTFLLLGMGSIVVLNYKSCSLERTKLIAYYSFLFILTLFGTAGFLDVVNEKYYSFTLVLVISLFYVSLLLPWRVSDIIVVTFIHWLANGLYHHTLSWILNQPINFDLFFEGFIATAVTAVFCMVIRYQDNLKDVNNFLLLKEIEANKSKIENLNNQMAVDMAIASNVHQTLIPKSMNNNLVKIDITYLPMQNLGGDYAKYYFISKDKLIFMISDVTGHGVSSALIVNRIHNEFENLLSAESSPGSLLNKLNIFFINNFSNSGLYLTSFCGMIDFENKKLSYSSYGHIPQYVCGVGKEASELTSQTMMLGLEENKGIYEDQIDINVSDKIILFTDGVTEVENKNKEMFGDVKMPSILDSIKKDQDLDVNSHIIRELRKFGNSQFNDDVFIMSIELL